jgi:hypothetical protein
MRNASTAAVVVSSRAIRPLTVRARTVRPGALAARSMPGLGGRGNESAARYLLMAEGFAEH